ncbi:MAG: hypothetical protein A2Z27_00640 [candidate division Zixibacteria bacterium RBG_16_50_21]|nr:MAG: hypothetical protein A2Z27_00640 [candidate division Zixibacteria bacterium RBG_16_50_21]
MSVLITGITGFAGSHLAEYLLSHKERIGGTYLVDDFENVSAFQSRLSLVKCNLDLYSGVLDLLKKIKPSQIYHLAATSSVGRSFSQPEEAYRNNFSATINVLEAVRQLSLRTRILISGSAEIYGRVPAKDLPLKENQLLKPVSPYGLSKAMCDLLAYQYWLHYDIEVIRVRAFNHIGPRQSPGFVIPDFVSQVAKIQLGLQEPVLQVGNLSAKRDFTDVRDIVRGYHLLMQKGKAGEAYHLSSGRAVSLREVVRMLQKLSHRRFTVISQQSKRRPQDIPILIGDNSKTRRVTGWKPKIDLRVTLGETLEYWTYRFGGGNIKKSRMVKSRV